MNEIVSQILSGCLLVFVIIYYNTKIAVVLDEKQFMVKALFMILLLLVMLYIVDKIFFPSKHLMAQQSIDKLFALIERLMFMLFGYYFAKSETIKNK